MTIKLQKPTEDCGVVGVYSLKGNDISSFLYLGMQYIQHRGQDAAGITIFNGKFHTKRKMGLVSDLLNDISNSSMPKNGWIGIGHTRYPTTGHSTIDDVQPSTSKTTALAHNGHVANYNDLKVELKKKGIELKTKVDSEVILKLFDEIEGNGASIEERVKHVMENIDGSYAVVAIYDNKLIAFRDPIGIRPLVYGWKRNKEGDIETIMFASESCALTANGIYEFEDVKGGELIIISKDISKENGKGNNEKTINKHTQIIQKIQIMDKSQKHCMFEYVYFSRPDSKIDGKLVMDVRKRLGELLAKHSPVNADVIIPVPDTSRTAANEYSRILSIPVEEGLIKNRYIGRTFIMPSQKDRETAVRLKLNPVKEIIEGKNVVLIDDSIVRGTTMRDLVKLIKKVGAKSVHVRITSPPIKAPCFYGVDMSTYKELIASHNSVEEIRKFLDADTLEYLSIEDLKEAIGLPICTGCLNEDYPTKKGAELAKERKEGNDDSFKI